MYKYIVYVFPSPKIEYLELKQEALATMDSTSGGFVYIQLAYKINADGRDGGSVVLTRVYTVVIRLLSART